MWLGLMHFTPAEDGVERELGVIVAYEPHRLFTVGAPVEALPTVVRLFRESVRQTGGIERPRCGSCGAELEVPPLEEQEQCASA